MFFIKDIFVDNFVSLDLVTLRDLINKLIFFLDYLFNIYFFFLKNGQIFILVCIHNEIKQVIF